MRRTFASQRLVSVPARPAPRPRSSRRSGSGCRSAPGRAARGRPRSPCRTSGSRPRAARRASARSAGRPCGTWITPGTMPCERISIGATGRKRLAGEPVAVAVALRRDLPALGPERLARGGRRSAAYSAAGSTRTARHAVEPRSGRARAGGTRPKPVRQARPRVAPARSTSPWRSARPSWPPKAPRICVLREPSTSGTSMPPGQAQVGPARRARRAALRQAERAAPAPAARLVRPPGQQRLARRASRAQSAPVSAKAQSPVEADAGTGTPAPRCRRRPPSLPSSRLPAASARSSMAPAVPTPQRRLPRRPRSCTVASARVGKDLDHRDRPPRPESGCCRPAAAAPADRASGRRRPWRCCRWCSSRSARPRPRRRSARRRSTPRRPGCCSTGTLRRGVAMRGSMPPR